jgi:predicted dehydrogenase
VEIKPRLRLAMLGGGVGSFIGETHRLAARLDNRYELVAGAFSTNPERNTASGKLIGTAPERTYDDWQELLKQEAQRDDGAEVIAIVTPNHLHYPMALLALGHGFDVICDKPLTNTLEEALKLHKTAKEHGLVFALTHNYSGYPMVRHARAMVQASELGELRLVQVEFATGWAASLLEADGHKQAAWRTTPEFAGQSTIVGDLGTHAHQMARFITGLEVTEVSAELMTVVPGRKSDDNAHVKLHFESGVKGMMWASMAATGSEHGLKVRIVGSQASLEWHQEDPNHLTLRHLNAPPQRLGRGNAYLSEAAKRSTRVGTGHPEGFFEAFANIYTDAADAIVERRYGIKADPLAFQFPNVVDGVRGMKFIEACVVSNKNNGAWTDSSISL